MKPRPASLSINNQPWQPILNGTIYLALSPVTRALKSNPIVGFCNQRQPVSVFICSDCRQLSSQHRFGRACALTSQSIKRRSKSDTEKPKELHTTTRKLVIIVHPQTNSKRSFRNNEIDIINFVSNIFL